MNWLNKHLNIGYAIILVISVLVVIFSIIIRVASTSGEIPVVLIIGSLVSSVIILSGSAWVLLKKGQSLWYLALILVFSLALFVLVFVLPNKKTGQGEGKKIQEADYYKEREADKK